MDTIKKRYNLYRYQILPIVRKDIQIDFFYSLISTLDELINAKNDILKSVISEITNLKYRNQSHNHKVHIYDNLALIKIGSRKVLSIENQDFEVDEIESWPSELLILDFDKHSQKIAVSYNPNARPTTNTATKILESNLNRHLRKFNLAIHIKPIFRSNDIWELIEDHKENITGISFNIITPNMSSISDNLAKDLKVIASETDSHETELILKSDKNSTLNLDKDSDIDGLIDYTSKGGGEVSIKVRGIRRRFHSDDNQKDVEIDDIDITNPDENVLKLIKSIMK